jgi:excisionase family DNA binding protein
MERITPSNTKTPQAEKELLSVSEISEQYDLHPNTVRGYYRSGRLPAVLLGPRMIRIRRSDIEHLLTPYQAEASVWARPGR